jgi:argininosuccinate lyase
MEKPHSAMAKPQAAPADRMWGGRFAGGPAEIMQRINASIDIDRRLYLQDIAGSRAHAAMLVRQAIISQADGEAIRRGLDQIEQEIAGGSFIFKPELEDIHTNVESRLRELIGTPAGRLHTARSRNDQVATAVRLWIRDAIDAIDAQISELIAAFIDRADEHAATIMPGYTHMQIAQPVTFGHHLLAYAEMLGRDRGRFADCRRRLNECPLGAVALAGTSFPIDPSITAAALGFARPMANSMDAVSARDFAVEFLGSSAILATHLSRFAEELVLWTSEAFRFVSLGDGFTTGSSIMPQKRNPDAAELVRAKSGQAIAALVRLLVVLKGLPLTYGKDMQEDKQPIFLAADDLALSLAAATGMLRDLKVDARAMRRACDRGFITATDLADGLVRDLGLPFREAHHITGVLVRLAEQKGCGLSDLPLADMQRVEPRITAQLRSSLTVEAAVEGRRSPGGTAPVNVHRAAARARERLL